MHLSKLIILILKNDSACLGVSSTPPLPLYHSLGSWLMNVRWNLRGMKQTWESATGFPAYCVSSKVFTLPKPGIAVQSIDRGRLRYTTPNKSCEMSRKFSIYSNCGLACTIQCQAHNQNVGEKKLFLKGHHFTESWTFLFWMFCHSYQIFESQCLKPVKYNIGT